MRGLTLSGRHRLAPPVAILAAALVTVTVAGCQQTPREAESGRQHVSFQLDWVLGSFFAPYVLADTLGYYKDQGLTVSFVQGRGADTTARLVSEGRQVIGTGNAAATATAVSQGLKIKSVAVIDKEAVTSIFSPPREGIKRPQDLLGRTLGVRYYDVSHSDYLAMMRTQGLDTRKVKEVGIGFDLQPLVAGRVDAEYQYFYNLGVQQLKIAGTNLNEMRVSDWGVRGYGANIVANTTYLKEHGDVVRRFLSASAKGWERAASHPEEAISALASKYPDLDRRAALESLKAQLTVAADRQGRVTLCQSAGRWTEVLATFAKVGLLKSRVSPDQVYTNEYVSECAGRDS